MKQLPLQFESHGSTHIQLKRDGMFAIYSRQGGPCPLHWEVIKVQHNKARTLAGKFIPESEGYPPTSEWGQQGWTFTNLPDAETAFEALVAAHRLANPPKRDFLQDH